MAHSGIRSPLAPPAFGELPVIKGVRFSSANAGIKYRNRDDVMLAVAQAGSTVAGVFTRSATRSAHVLDCQAKLARPLDCTAPIAFFVNAGNANAFTGRYGDQSVAAICDALAGALAMPVAQVFSAATGVIGQRLPHDRILGVVDQLVGTQSAHKAAAAARAIMTTDTFAKAASSVLDIDGQRVQIMGFAKGSGMIAPDMATMLVYLFTDAAVNSKVLQELLDDLVEPTFNSITVDGDTSTSDSVMLLASAASGIQPIEDAHSPQGLAFRDALYGVMLDLAHQIVRDGEGASKFIEIAISGAQSAKDAKAVGMAIANSPLVKTALAGEDPNWGRIVMAVGKSGATAKRDCLSIWFGDILVAENGWIADGYQETQAAAYLKQAEVCIRVDLGLGTAQARVWTCDLTHDYITINADYRS